MVVLEEHVGLRFDRVVADWFSDYSRARLQTWIGEGAIVLDGRKVAPKTKLKGGETIVARLPEPAGASAMVEPQDIALAIHYKTISCLSSKNPPGW